jgi:lipid-binding SYLF domain-containing protein
MPVALRLAGALALSIAAAAIVAAQDPPPRPTAPAAVNRGEMSDEARRIQDSIQVLRDLTTSADNTIPHELLDRAEAIVVIPSLIKGGFIVGAKHGKGVISVRDRGSKTWSAPAFVNMTGGSIGWQIGLQSIDLVLLVMNRNGLDQLLEDKFTIGGSASIAAGPVGRSADAATNAQLNAGLLAYSRAQGLFAGATLEGAALAADKDANAAFYGRALGIRQITAGPSSTTNLPAMAQTWRSAVAGISSVTR